MQYPDPITRQMLPIYDIYDIIHMMYTSSGHLLRPRHHQRAGRSVGTVVQLNGDGLDPAHGLVAVAAAKFQIQG